MDIWSKKRNSNYFHIYDYVHVVKNIRNTLLNRIVCTPSEDP
jgi:hypothetical protein